jgi:hypothetical protein
MAKSSFSHRRKLAWADHHIKGIEAMFETWKHGGYRICEQTNAEGGTMVLAQQLEPLPDDLVLAVGDAFHCQRASLDHIVYALAKANTKTLRDDEERDIAFPISDRAIERGDKRMKWVSDSAKRAIIDLTPDPARQPNHDHPLWLLNKMENRDKHREIPVAVMATHVSFVVHSGWEFFKDYGPKRLEVGGKPVLVCEFTEPDADKHVGLDMQPVFDEGTEMANWPVLRRLRTLSEHIRETVFQRLEPHL